MFTNFYFQHFFMKNALPFRCNLYSFDEGGDGIRINGVRKYYDELSPTLLNFYNNRLFNNGRRLTVNTIK